MRNFAPSPSFQLLVSVNVQNSTGLGVKVRYEKSTFLLIFSIENSRIVLYDSY